MVEEAGSDGPKNPEQYAGFFSRLLYLWIDPLLRLGCDRPLETEDLYELQKSDRSEYLAKRFDHEWSAELATQERGDRKASLPLALLKAHGSLFLFAAPLKFLYDILHFVGPFALHGLLDNLGADTAMLYALLLLCSMLLQTLLLQTYFMLCFRAGIHVQCGVMSAVYRKALKLSTGSRNKESVGQIVNLLSVDANRIGPRLLPYAHMLWSGPVQIITAFIILYMMIGMGAVFGFTIMVLVIPLNLRLARAKNAVQRQLMQRKDERVRVLNELMSFIRQVKFFAWEGKLREQVEEAREVELKSLRHSSILSALGLVLWSVAPLAVSCVAFATMALSTDTPITPARVFVALALFNILKFPLSMFPSLINSSIESNVAAGRIEKFLLSPEAPGRRQEDQQPSIAAALRGSDYGWIDRARASPISAQPSEKTALLKDSEASETSNVILHEPKLEIQSGLLVAVVGPVGCGKSSLLLALLGEMPSLSTGERTDFLNGVVSYAGQTPWLLNATIRENILNGEDYDADRYEQVIDACCLGRDLGILAVGDATEIGEKGIILSGGQKARVALARAIYRQADVYLFDDPISAVDAQVGKIMFERAIAGPLLKAKTRILVTHHLHYLESVDRVVVLDNGKLAADGTYTELTAQGYTFSFLSRGEDSDDDLDEGRDLIDAVGPAPINVSVTNGADKNAAEDSKANSKIPTAITEITNGKGEVEVEKNTKSNGSVADKGTSDGKLMVAEERAVGKVRLSLYFEYFKAAGYAYLCLYLCVSIVLTMTVITVDTWLSKWSGAAVAAHGNIDNRYYISMYVFFAIVASMLSFTRQLMVVFAILRAGKTLHDQMLRALLRSPVSFFDSTPLGRIINRFSKDQTSVDEDLPSALTSYLTCLLNVMGTVSVIVFVTWRIVFLIVPLAFFYAVIGKMYIMTSRELRRLESNTKGPILAFFAETLVGVETVRAFGSQNRFIHENEKRINENTKPMLLNVASNRWLSVRLETVGTILVASSALLAVFGKDYVPASLAGLSITYALQITQTLGWMVRMSTDAETQMNSVERVSYYAHLPPEAPEQQPDDPPLKSWPTEGKVEFDNVILKYRPELEPALAGVSFKLQGGEKLGVVGRTGAGKTSLAQALFRMVELSGGRILIDDVDVSKLGLFTLRSRLAIITQDPMLVSATIRYNLDPFGSQTDAEIWSVLEMISMKDVVQDLGNGLDSQVHDGGQNFSVGQRQLLCLARALLCDAKVMILDEATAAIDHETDELVQSAIRMCMKDCTLITIAHRLQTVMNSDQVLVMDAGVAAEFGPPATLLQNRNGVFSALVDEVGGDAALVLRKMAKDSAKNKSKKLRA